MAGDWRVKSFVSNMVLWMYSLSVSSVCVLIIYIFPVETIHERASFAMVNAMLLVAYFIAPVVIVSMAECWRGKFGISMRFAILLPTVFIANAYIAYPSMRDRFGTLIRLLNGEISAAGFLTEEAFVAIQLVCTVGSVVFFRSLLEVAAKQWTKVGERSGMPSAQSP